MSEGPWRRIGSAREVPVRERWRRREAGWRALRILSRHGTGDRYFTRYDYARMWVAQKGKCGLCDKPLTVVRWEAVSGFPDVGTGRGIDVDHAHSNGYARALLHGLCNRMVSHMDSKKALLVLNYLLKHEGVEG